MSHTEFDWGEEAGWVIFMEKKFSKARRYGDHLQTFYTRKISFNNSARAIPRAGNGSISEGTEEDLQQDFDSCGI